MKMLVQVYVFFSLFVINVITSIIIIIYEATMKECDMKRLVQV
jgi:hypothetical protein